MYVLAIYLYIDCMSAIKLYYYYYYLLLLLLFEAPKTSDPF